MFEEIQEQFNKVISYSQNIPEPQTDDLFQKWKDNKKYWYKILGEQLILNVGKVSFELSIQSKKQRYNSFLEWVEQFENETGYLTQFLGRISAQDFYANTLDQDFWITDTTKIPKGSKIIKSFKHFINDERLLRDFQDKASEIIQENKVEGELCFSIHPLDFLSLSENQFHWRSCHALDGDYRCGNLSYMCDMHTVICYLKGKEDVVLPRFPNDIKWNNKKWRCLLFVDDPMKPNVIFAGRQYPFFTSGSLNLVKDHLVARFPAANWWEETPIWTPWYKENISTYTFEDDVTMPIMGKKVYPLCNSIYKLDDLVTDAKNAKHYNDLLYSSCYEPHYTFNARITKTDIKFVIGSETMCLRCGENVVQTVGTMMCPNCEIEYGTANSDDFASCDLCGSRFLYEDAEWVGDDRYCPQCFIDHTFECEECGERYNNYEKKYVSKIGKYVCNQCYTRDQKTIFLFKER